eukprot:351656-Chlamydomonas_euryale.AAC.2
MGAKSRGTKGWVRKAAGQKFCRCGTRGSVVGDGFQAPGGWVDGKVKAGGWLVKTGVGWSNTGAGWSNTGWLVKKGRDEEVQQLPGQGLKAACGWPSERAVESSGLVYRLHPCGTFAVYRLHPCVPLAPVWYLCGT